jgi:hypothetical protein
VATIHPEVEMPHKPGRRVPEPPERPGRGTPEPETPGIVDVLDENNAELLTMARKLATIHGGEQRSTLLGAVEQRLGTSRRIGEMLRPLLDSSAVGDALSELDELDRSIDQGIERLHEPSPSPHELSVAVQVLRGMIEQRIERERESLIAAYRSSVGAEQGVELARGL